MVGAGSFAELLAEVLSDDSRTPAVLDPELADSFIGARECEAGAAQRMLEAGRG